MRLIRAVCLAGLAALASATPAASQTIVEKGMIRFVVGDPQAVHAELLIKPRFNARHVIDIRLVRAARPGARLELRVDAATAPILSTIIAPADCDGPGPAVCRVVVPGHGGQAEAIIGAFKAGRTLHVSVVDGSEMMLQSSGSLMGFMGAFRQAAR